MEQEEATRDERPSIDDAMDLARKSLREVREVQAALHKQASVDLWLCIAVAALMTYIYVKNRG